MSKANGGWRATIYFDSPIAKWQERAPAENEILARRTFRWRWLAESWLVSRTKGFRYVACSLERLL